VCALPEGNPRELERRLRQSYIGGPLPPYRLSFRNNYSVVTSVKSHASIEMVVFCPNCDTAWFFLYFKSFGPH
jgi:hypothetical protein